MEHAAAKLTISAEDFLDWEAGQALRHEFLAGKVIARDDTEDRHVTVAGNLAMEVLSPSTAAYDRGAKFAACRTLPTLGEYLLIDIDRQATQTEDAVMCR